MMKRPLVALALTLTLGSLGATSREIASATDARSLHATAVADAPASVSAGLPNPSPAPLKVLRHLTFDFTLNSHSKVDSHSSGFERNDLSGSNGPQGSGSSGSGTMGGSFGSGSFGTENSGLTSSTGPSTISNGTIFVDVMAATGDGGLVVDVSEDANKRSPVTRVGINDRTLYYDNTADVTDEERTILHYLARDLVKADTLTVGTAWSDDISQGAGTSGHMRFKVTSVDDDAKTIGVAIAGNGTQSGANAIASTINGSMLYDLGTLVPLRLSLTTRSMIDKSGDEITIDSQLTSTLKSDSFKKAP